MKIGGLKNYYAKILIIFAITRSCLTPAPASEILLFCSSKRSPDWSQNRYRSNQGSHDFCLQINVDQNKLSIKYRPLQFGTVWNGVVVGNKIYSPSYNELWSINTHNLVAKKEAILPNVMQYPGRKISSFTWTILDCQKCKKIYCYEDSLTSKAVPFSVGTKLRELPVIAIPYNSNYGSFVSGLGVTEDGKFIYGIIRYNKDFGRMFVKSTSAGSSTCWQEPDRMMGAMLQTIYPSNRPNFYYSFDEYSDTPTFFKWKLEAKSHNLVFKGSISKLLPATNLNISNSDSGTSPICSFFKSGFLHLIESVNGRAYEVIELPNLNFKSRFLFRIGDYANFLKYRILSFDNNHGQFVAVSISKLEIQLVSFDKGVCKVLDSMKMPHSDDILINGGYPHLSSFQIKK